MKALLENIQSGIYWYPSIGIKRYGAPPGLRGDVTGLYGDLSGLRGDVTGLRGDVSGLCGDVSGLRGDLDECEITLDERKNGISIALLVATKAQP